MQVPELSGVDPGFVLQRTDVAIDKLANNPSLFIARPREYTCVHLRAGLMEDFVIGELEMRSVLRWRSELVHGEIASIICIRYT